MNNDIAHSATVRLLGVIACSALLAGCADTCESVADEIQAIGLEINREENPWERAEELQALQEKMEEMGCLQ